MDTIEIYLLVLISVSIVCIILLTAFLCKFLLSANKLVNGLNKACDTINGELKPVVEGLKETLSGVNSIIKAADNRVKVINCALNGILGATGVLGGKLKSVASGLVEGFKAGINILRK